MTYFDFRGLALFGVSLIFCNRNVVLFEMLRRGRKRSRDNESEPSAPALTLDHNLPGTLFTDYSALISNVAHLYSRTALSDRDECELLVQNNFGESCIFCWVSETGRLFHYRVVCGGVTDGSVSSDALEITHSFHSFVILRQRATYPEQLNQVSVEVSNIPHL